MRDDFLPLRHFRADERGELVGPAADDYTANTSRPERASTDANIPLSRGVPAIAIGGGGTGGGIHTLQEWYDPTGRETALRRILLTLLDTLQTMADSRANC